MLQNNNRNFSIGQEVLQCGTRTDGSKSEWYIRQDYSGANPLPLKYSENRIDWTTTAPDDLTFTLGACPVDIVEPICIENVSYDLDGAKGIIFEANKLNSYDAQVISGEMKYTEKNVVGYVEETYSHSNGFTDDYKLMPNELKIVNKNANSRTIIKVLQVCGYQPIIADVIDETMVLLISAIPKDDNSAIDVTFTDVPPDGGAGATGYRIKRYVVGANPNTATTLINWTEGVANPLITNNNNGSYTYKDATAVIDVDYMYFYEAYNPVSEGVSNEIEASLFSTSFQPVMRTTLANETVTLPMTVTSPVTIDWGDGTTTTQGAPFTKVYATAGDYHIKVNITASREVTNFRFGNTGDRLKLIDVRNWGWAKFGTIGGNFWGCSNLEKITAEDTPRDLVNMANFFNGCSKLNQIDNFNWDTTNVTTMSNLFFNCSLFNLAVNQLSTANVTDMSGIFYGCSIFNRPLSNWDTTKATSMENMFALASAFNQPVSTFNTINVTNMRDMFNSAIAFNQPVPFNTSKVTTMINMFRNASVFNQSVNFDTSKVTTMFTMFQNAIAFNQPVIFNIPLLTTAQNMFLNATSFNTTNMDNCLINFAGQTTQNNVPMTNNRPRTSASNSAVTILQSRGWTGLV